MTQYACWRCGHILLSRDWWCEACQEKTLAVEVIEPGPRMRPGQYYAICKHYKSIGEVNYRRRMLDLGTLVGRPVQEYDLTEAEADKVLKGWADAV